MATFIAKIRVFAGAEAKFEAIAQTMYEATLKEKGCLRYEYWRGAEPRSYYCLESWDDYRCFIDHQTSDHHEAPDWGSLLEHIEIEWLDPVDQASALPPTNEQALPEDSSAAARAHAERLPAKVQSWWMALRKT